MSTSPSRIAPQLISISSSRRSNIGVLVANFMDGLGFAPKHDPRPVVNAIILAPPAICPVAETGSNPGVSIKTKPLASTRSAYL